MVSCSLAPSNTNARWRDRQWWRVDDESGCWIWLLTKSAKGYGYVWFEGRSQAGHRITYKHFKGPIPPGLEIDHLCRNRLCVNPDHLEAVTHAENIRRADHSNNGGSTPIKTWSRRYAACIDCGRTDRRHAQEGRCTACRRRWRYAQGLPR